MNKKLLKILVCPVCKRKLEYIKNKNVMICHFDGIEYSVRKGIPVLLEFDSKQISSDQDEN